MYSVYCDDKLIYNPRIEELKIKNTKLTLELNKTSSFSFLIHPTHPYFNYIKKLKSVIQIFDDDFLIFKGRVITDDEGFHKEKQIVCEGQIAYLLDSTIRPYEHKGSIEELFKFYINSHNEQVEEIKRFKIGKITVKDENNLIVRSNVNYVNTWKEIEEKLIKLCGGYIFIRHEKDGDYIDYLEDFNNLNSQKIEFGKNLLNYKKSVKADDIATVIIPIGKQNEQTKEKLTIKEVNHGLDYIKDEEAVLKYGLICKVIEFPNVTKADNLLKKGREFLSQAVKMVSTIVLDAVDLTTIQKNISSFRIGQKIEIISKIHSINDFFLVKKLNIDLQNPKGNKVSIGAVVNTLTENNKNKIENITNNIDIKLNESKNDTIRELTTEFNSKLKQTETNIKLEVAEKVYTKSETKELVKEVSTKLEQTKDEFAFIFRDFEKDLNDISNINDNKFMELYKYIRFRNGIIELGEKNNPLILKLKNDRIQFLQNGYEVAYFSNNKLYITDGEFLHSLRLGKFAFYPRENGNLSFKMVGK